MVSATKSGDSFVTGKYWASTDPEITSFYASNVSPTFAASGPTVTLADCNTDVVCAHAADPSYGEPCALTFGHILARMGSITLATQTGYELSAVSATLKSAVTAGTYNLRTGAWSSLGAGSNSDAAAFEASGSSQVSSNDLWLVPGTYTLSISYTLTKGDYVKSFTKSGSVALVAGKTNNISTTAVGGSASEIVFSISITAWGGNDVPMTFLSEQVNQHPFSVSGSKTVKFTTANLMYEGSATNKWHLMEYPWSMVESIGSVSLSSSSQIGLFGWATSGYNSKNPWMTSTTNTDYGPAASSGEWSPAASWDWGKYNTIYDYSGTTLSNVRTLTDSEWSYLVDHANPAWSKINGVYGILLFSDDYSHPVGLAAIVNGFDVDEGSDRNIFTSAQFEQMSAAGAIFLPSAGCRNGSTVYGRGSYGYYWSSSIGDGEYACSLYFDSYGVYIECNYRSYGYSVRLVVDE